MVAPQDVPNAPRALGWDVRSAYSSNRGTRLSARAFGHGGYTGTSLWIDPEKDLFILFLSNRVHPDGGGAINPLAGRLADIAVGALEPGGAPGDEVETGIDVLVSENFAPLRGAHIGLVTNASGRSRSGARTVDLLHAAKDLELVALFAPEHGLGSDREGSIQDGRDSATGLPVYSLYGEHFEPSAESLRGVDTLVFDIQDAGSRFFTYASTLKHVMRAAAEKGLRLVVLDRPDPIDGVHVGGPVLDPARAFAKGGGSFVNHHPLPVRHGMTMGELARLFDADLHLGARLEVVKMRGWNRGSFYDETGLPWTNPSPNLRSTDEALLYDGVGLLEGTNLSVGRGTATPFELVGAPYVDGAALASELGRIGAPGVRFEKTTFTPTASRFARQICSGVRIAVVDRRRLDPVHLGIVLATALRKLYPDDWRVEDLDSMIADAGVVRAIEAGEPPAAVEALWGAALSDFRAKRENYLLYEARRPTPP
jgi:uncharacterized protein YbbC (DUF1343 family)